MIAAQEDNDTKKKIQLSQQIYITLKYQLLAILFEIDKTWLYTSIGSTAPMQLRLLHGSIVNIWKKLIKPNKMKQDLKE